MTDLLQMTEVLPDTNELRRAAARSMDADAARRTLALALVQDGASRTEAAKQCGMDRQILLDWCIATTSSA
jgi:hypothetical protein